MNLIWWTPDWFDWFDRFLKWQSYQFYDEAYQQYVTSPSSQTLAAYIELHNNYVQDVHACNAMAEQFNNHVLPQLVQVSVSQLS